MHQFRVEITSQFDRLNERLAAIEAAAAARGAERARSAAKGADFEDLLEAMLADFARGAGDLLDRTGSARRAARSAPRRATSSLTIDPARTGGTDVRIVVEAKDRQMSGRAIREELREAKENRAAAVAARGLRAGPRAGRHRPVRRPRRRRLLRDRPGEP